LNQGQCGSCWAFGTTEAFSDRICVATNGSTNVVVSPQEVVSCDITSEGCNGGFESSAWGFFQINGVKDIECYPYTSGDGESGSCKLTCPGGGSSPSYHSTLALSFSIPQGQQEMFTNGPISTCFDVYQDFMNYTGGVYV